MNKKCTPLRDVKLDSPQSAQMPFVFTDEMKETFHTIANETAEEYAKRIPEPKIVRPNVTIQCDGTVCKSVRNDVGTIKTDIGKINSKAKSIVESLTTISNDLGKRPCLKCAPRELSGFYFRGRHVNASYVFTIFVSLFLLVIVECVVCCIQQAAARENLETAVRWNAIYLECNHKYEQLVKEVKDNLLKKKSKNTSGKRK